MVPRNPMEGSGRHARAAVAVAALAMTVLFFGCGRVPPESFWEPSAEDSAAIDAAVRANVGYFRFDIQELQMTMIDTVLPGSTATILRDELTGNPFKPRFRADGFQHVFSRDSLQYTFIATLDTAKTETTCTVTAVETIPGLFNIHAYAMTDSLRESLFFPNPGETLRLPYYSSTMSPRDEVVSKPLAAVTSGGCVLKKSNGQWSVWKLAGGNRFYAPSMDDAPYYYWIYLVGGGRTDTITLRADTLHYGMQRFYALEDTSRFGILTYTKNDTLRISNLTTNNGNAATYLHFRGMRTEFKTTTRIPLADVPAGLYQLYVEHIPIQVLWENQGSYNATVWGIPVRVKE